MQRRFHYDRAFEAYLRARRVPYVAVDEARKTLLPRHDPRPNLKSFDFVIYGENVNLIVDVKGRKCTGSVKAGAVGRLETWVTQDDVESLSIWEHLFGEGFVALFVFLYWCDAQPPDGLFQEVFQEGERWYIVRAVRLSDYKAHMKPRSAKWQTVDVPGREFAAISQPFCPAASGGIGSSECDEAALRPR